MNEKIVKFVKADRRRSIYDCADGEVEYCAGVRFAADGSLVGIGEIQATAPDNSTARIGHVRVSAGAEGLTYSIIKDDSVIQLGMLPQCPAIDFGMRKVATLSCNEIITVSGVYASRAGGSGASATHPTATDAVAEKKQVADTVTALYRRAIAAQASARGLLHRPFMIRCALRLYDGSHVSLSNPVLMLPWALPPCLGVTVRGTSTDSTLLQTDFSRCLLFSLRYRIRNGIPAVWRDIIEAVDIFISPEIDTCDLSAADTAHICSYADLLGGVNTGHRRGRDNGATSAQVFAGRFSVGDDNFSDHTVDSLAMADIDVWHVAPNARMAEEIKQTADFYRIASIPFDRITASEEYADLEIDSTDFTRLAENPRLEDSSRIYERVKAGALYAYADRLHAAVDGIALPTPLQLPEGCGEVEVTVVSKAGGRYGSSTATYTYPGTALADDFPRYLYHADPSACLMVLRQGDMTWSLPLTRHDRLKGAYWFGGLGHDHAPAPDAEPPQLPKAVETGLSLTPNMLVSAAANPFRPECAMRVGAGHIHDFCSAPGVVSQGQMGDFPLYVFATDGIYALRSGSGAECAYKGYALIAGIEARSAVSTGTAVAALAAGMLLIITGSRCKQIPLPTGSACIAALPGIRPVEVSADSSPVYDSVNALIVIAGTGGAALLYDPDADAWTYTAHGSVVTVVTRPIKLESPASAQTPVAVKLLGTADTGRCSLTLYGTADMRHWHRIAAVGRATTGAVFGSPYTAIRIACTTALDDGACLWGARISYQRR